MMGIGGQECMHMDEAQGFFLVEVLRSRRSGMHLWRGFRM